MEPTTRYSYSFSGFPGYGFYSVYGFHRGGFVGGFVDGQARPRTRYDAVANIVMFRGEPESGNIKAFNARELQQFLSPKVQRPGALAVVADS